MKRPVPKRITKITYEVDPHNRLVLKSGKPSQVKRYRAVLDGTFKIDKDNYLIYHVKKPSPVFLGKKLPQKIYLKGSWSLTKRHNLIYTLDKWQNQIYGNRLILKSGIADARGNEFLFTLTTKEKNKTRTHLLRLSGSWQADKFNRLTFIVEKEKGKRDALTFKNIWRINKNNEIVYEYNKESEIRTLILKGLWDITERHKLFYNLEKSTNSKFEFRAGLTTTFRERGLQFTIGIGKSERKRPKMRIITLFGRWRIKNRFGLVFEMNYGKRKVHSIIFGASLKLKKNHTFEINLKDRRNQPLGIRFTLSRSFLKNQARSFITLLKEKHELAITTGVGFLF